MLEENLLPFEGEVHFIPDLFSAREGEDFLKALSQEVPWVQEPIFIFGRELMQPRLTAWYGDRPYSYSGITMKPLPWSNTLRLIKDRVEQVCSRSFNSALLNHYRDGRDSVGWHRDNEKELGARPYIASVSFGATREFQLRPYGEKTPKVGIQLSNSSLLIMKGNTQHHWEHCLPKRSRVSGPRINITFRNVL